MYRRIKKYITKKSTLVSVFAVFGLAVAIFGTISILDFATPATQTLAYADGDTCALSTTGPDDILVSFENILGPGGVIVANGAQGDEWTGAVHKEVPSGEYKITLQSYDDHSSNGGQNQLSEIWNLQFRKANLDVLASTPNTIDIPDNEDTIIRVVSERFPVPAGVKRLAGFHGAYPSSASESVRPVCALLQPVVELCNPQIDLLPGGGGNWDPFNQTKIIVKPNGTAEVSIQNTSQKCPYEVHFSSYNVYRDFGAPDFIDTQTLYDDKEITLDPGESKTLVVDVPLCRSQIDIYTGPFAPDSNPDFGNAPLSATHTLFDWDVTWDVPVCGDTEEPTITVIKTVINDNGGTAVISDFDLFVAGTQVVSGVANSFEPGAYHVSETNLPGYVAGSWGGDCSINGNITLGAGEHLVCTITNNDIPPPPPPPNPAHLKLVKTVINDDGGTLSVSDFPLFVGGTQVASGVRNAFAPGTFFVNETQQPGYVASNWTGDCSANGAVTLLPGDDKTCYITNNDIPTTPTTATLTIKKVVINDDGGVLGPHDFPLFIGQKNVASGSTVTLTPGVYTLSEEQQSGYKSLGWSGDCTVGGVVFVTPGSHKSCTITNDDVQKQTKKASITLIKKVINDDGGTLGVIDFPLFIDNTQVASGVKVEIEPGVYTASEEQQSGYKSLGWKGDCTLGGSVILLPGDDKICTITNDDIPVTTNTATLTLVKTVINDDGGTLSVSDFPLFVNNDEVTSGVTVTLSPGTYTASEENKPGYSAGDWTGDCSAGGSVILLPGDNKVCRITNNDVPGQCVAPDITLPSNGQTFTVTVGDSVSVAIDVNGTSPVTVTTSDLPDGLFFDSGELEIFGTPTQVGEFEVTIHAENKCGDDEITIIIKIVEIGQCIPPVTVTPPPQGSEVGGTVGKPFSYQITTDPSSGVVVTATPLPAGLSFDPATNTISGTPSQIGSTAVAIVVFNSGDPDCFSETVLVITITGGGGGCVSNCGGGLNPPKVVLFEVATTTSFASQSFVYLNQVPYTGLGLSVLQIILFTLSLMVTAGLGAYLLIRFDFVSRLRVVGSHLYIRALRENNIIPIGDVDEEDDTEEIEYVSKTVVTSYNENTENVNTPRTDIVEAEREPVKREGTKVASLVALQGLARDMQALISEDGLALIRDASKESGMSPNDMLKTVVDIAKTRYPREDGWLALDRNRVKKTLFTSFLSMIPLFIEWLIEADDKKVFSFLRSLRHQEQPVHEFLRKVVTALDHVYKARIEGLPERMRADQHIADIVEHLPNRDVEQIIVDLLDGVDESYESHYASVRLCLVRVLDRMRERKNQYGDVYEYKPGIGSSSKVVAQPMIDRG
jgi:hypothetical protein